MPLLEAGWEEARFYRAQREGCPSSAHAVAVNLGKTQRALKVGLDARYCCNALVVGCQLRVLQAQHEQHAQ
jgi:hypothetical protein